MTIHEKQMKIQAEVIPVTVSPETIKKLLAKEFYKGNIRLSIRLWKILIHEFDIGNPGLTEEAK